MENPTRRQVLGAVSGTALLAFGAAPARSAAGLDPVEPNQSTQIQTGESLPTVALDWRETVNGVVTEDTDLSTGSTGHTGDVGLVVDEAVLPGDTGAVTLRASLADGTPGANAAQSAAVSLHFALTDTAENGRNEPERAAGDETAETGELQDFATIELWRDMGLGTGNGANENIPFVTDGDEMIASGTLAEVDADPVFDDGYPLSRSGESCLSVGDAVYVTFRWSIPERAGNVIQGDSAQFVVGVTVEACGND
ncbi:hypothetical protein [Halobellus sp. H-GB7]|uniref:hypothetical protein n=1 Tax=Halobellus sp. H-GB7 TaxID=3069756 RepID=UPI0027AE6034|nr:hypothetical protein [Halobellus sp. H-GB7]MDQ2053893.1 hypothetical protein [Halobellus sp. H-GB7]